MDNMREVNDERAAMDRWWPLAAAILLGLALAGLSTRAVVAQANLKGQWQTLTPLMPINPIHLAVMNNGTVLIVAGSGNDPTVTNFRATVWTPQTGSFATQSVAWDMF